MRGAPRSRVRKNTSSAASIRPASTSASPIRSTARRITGHGRVSSATCSSRIGMMRWASVSRRSKVRRRRGERGEDRPRGSLGGLARPDRPGVARSASGGRHARLRHRGVDPVEAQHGVPRQAGRDDQPGKQGQVTLADDRRDVAAVEAGQVDLQLVGRAGQRHQGAEVLAGQLRQLVDERGQVPRRHAVDRGRGSVDGRSIPWLHVVAPQALGERNAVTHQRRQHAGGDPRFARHVPEHAGQAAQHVARARSS